MAKERTRDKMKIRSWTCAGYAGYQDDVHPELHKILASLGGNSIFAELAITETVHNLTEGRNENVLSVRVCIIANDLRVTMQTEHGSFPVGFVRRYMQAVPKIENRDDLGGFLSARTIWRILSPVEYAILSADGKKVTLFFRFPFTNAGTHKIEELMRKIYLEKDEVVYRETPRTQAEGAE